MPPLDHQTPLSQGARLSHEAWQDAFQLGLAAQNQAPAQGLFEGSPEHITAGWRVYLNNVAHSLVTALGDTFPVCKALVGNDFFQFTARQFMAGALPDGPVLHEYGRTFPEFIEHFEPAASLPFLADMSRLEWAWLQSYHAPGAEPLPIQVIQQRAPEELAECIPVLSPSVHILLSSHPVCSLWHAHQSTPPSLSDIDLGKPQSALVLRQDGDVKIVSISRATAIFFEAVQSGMTLSQSSRSAARTDEDFDLQAAFSLLLENALIIELAKPQDTAS